MALSALCVLAKTGDPTILEQIRHPDFMAKLCQTMRPEGQSLSSAPVRDGIKPF